MDKIARRLIWPFGVKETNKILPDRIKMITRTQKSRDKKRNKVVYNQME